MNAISPIGAINIATAPYREITTHVDKKYQVAWCYMRATSGPSFTPTLLNELKHWSHGLCKRADQLDIHYHVIASRIPEIYNLGGDLKLFHGLIQKADRDGLLAYGKQCIDALYANIAHFNAPITTISLVQGDALGGGFETALSSDVLIAEKGAQMGFPEILFNLFPGMGAYSLLSRKLDAKRAERMILSGKLYSAEELHSLGLVDVLADKGEGEMAVYEYIRRENRARNGFQAVRQVRDALDPITYEELLQIVEIWVDTALKLEARDLRMMERLIARQKRVGARAA